MTKVVVVGGTGPIGSKVVPKLGQQYAMDELVQRADSAPVTVR
ncbi:MULTISPECIES: hypothetical protein [unclassified Mycolicibacterium]|nr:MULTISPECIES: hypothetical protein [unclassified Mycolicibacterium]